KLVRVLPIVHVPPLQQVRIHISPPVIARGSVLATDKIGFFEKKGKRDETAGRITVPKLERLKKLTNGGCHAHGFAWAWVERHVFPRSHAHAKPWAWHPSTAGSHSFKGS